MWNYSLTLPSVMVLLVILGYYFLRPRLPIRKNNAFLSLLLVDIFTILFDYVSSRFDENYAGFPIALGYILNLAFFVFFLARIFCFANFAKEILSANVELPRIFRGLFPVVFLIAEGIAISSPWTHAVFYMDKAGYHRGCLYDILYICFFFYLFLTIVILCIYAKKISRFFFISLLVCNLILIAGNIARILFPQYLVMKTFCLLGILVLFLSFENPDLFLSERGYAYNTRAFRALLAEWGRTRACQIIGIRIQNYYEYRSMCGGRQMDRMISEISRYLSENHPNGTTFYLRNGNFALVIPGVSAQYIENSCEKIRSRFQHAWRTGDGELYTEPSFVRIESRQESSASPERIMTALFLTLDKAEAGTVSDAHGITVITTENINTQMQLRLEVEKAIEEDRVEIFLQPLIEAKTGNMVAAEALARLRNKAGDLIRPDIFIPLAERNGQIHQLGETVFAKACRFLSEHDPKDEWLHWINVNLSPVQCLKKDLSSRFQNILTQYQLPAERIRLEITEQSMLDFKLLKNQVQDITELGFLFALDDYGTGHSNLSRIRQYPFSNVKIDMEIIWAHIKNRDPILPNMVQTFRKMHYSITAEGIETAEMAAEMTQIGCDYLQGYYYSRPLPADEFLKKYKP